MEMKMATGRIESGDPIILVDGSNLEEYELTEGMKGGATEVVVLPEGTFVFFQPYEIGQVFALDTTRFEVDELEKKKLEEQDKRAKAAMALRAVED